MRHSSVEALNIPYSGHADQQDNVGVSTTTETIEVHHNYTAVLLQTTENLYFAWAIDETDIVDVNNSLYITGGDAIYTLNLPTAKAVDHADALYLQLQAVGDESYVRYTLT